MGTRISANQIRYQEAFARKRAACGGLYDAEIALHAARQSDVDDWVQAASEHLHMALLVLSVAEADVAEAARICSSDQDNPSDQGNGRSSRELCPVPVRRHRG